MILSEYVDERGRSAFGKWFLSLEARAAAKVRACLIRMEAGNLADVKSVGNGVLEARIHYGPGYRLYFGRDGDVCVILLCGGDKKTQRRDIETAHKLWDEYRLRKSKGKSSCH